MGLRGREVKKYIFRKKRNIFLASVLDAVGFLVCRFFRRPRKRPAGRGYRTILVIRMDHLGDVLWTTGVPKVLRESFPQARVVFLTSSWTAGLLEKNPFVDEVLLFDAPWFSKKRYPRSSQSLSFFKLISVLRKKKIDLGLGLRGDLRENLLMALGGIRERIGYGVTGGGFLLTREAPYRKDAHPSERTGELLGALGVKVSSLAPQLYLPEEEEEKLADRFREWGIVPGEKYVGFQAGAGTPAKEWPKEHGVEWMRRLARRFPDCRVILLGKSAEGRYDFGVPSDGLPQVIDLTGRTALRELCFLLRRLEAFVGPDSGPTQLAAALGIPTVFLYSGTNSLEAWMRPSETSTVLKHEVPCAPCGLEICKVKGHPCMTGIKPEEVIKALEGCLR
ncbi:MAG: glycosyltransferase family 9 protein [Candidatus Omnitrophica bacterium]|nr:glycosyltransferase family 9 protein [Candidatus Omnitrophota bacterium]